MAHHFDHPWVDNARAPLLLACFPDAPSVQQVEQFCTAMERFLDDSSAPFGWVSDFSEVQRVGAVQRQVFVDANRREKSRLEARIVAMAVYAPRPLQRGLVTMFTWFVPTKWPLQVFGDLEKAVAWVQEQLAEAGVSGEIQP